MAYRTGWAAIAVALGVIHCGGDATDEADDDAGSGAMGTTSTMSAMGGSAGSVTTANGGTGAASGPGGSGGSGGEPFVWSEPPLHLEEICREDVPTGEWLYFDIPDNTLGFTVAAQVPDNGVAVAVNTMRVTGGLAVISDYDVTGKDVDTFADFGAVAAANPQSDLPQAVPMHIGTWQVSFLDDGSLGEVDACVYARRTADGNFHDGVMDINVRIAPGAGVSNSYMQGVIDNLFDLYYGPDLDIFEGTVTFGTVAASFDVIGTGAEFAQLLQTSAGIGSRPAVNVFVVGNFSNTEFGNAIGVAGGIPGTPMIHGTGQSGVAYQPSGDQAYDARILAHEIGHLGGLFHTTEISIASTDPLSDTPECGNIGDPDNCPDKNNIMFPIAYGGTQISADQQMVLRASALYRGIVSAGGSPGQPLSASTESSMIDLVQTLPIVRQRDAADAAERLLSAIWCAHGGADYEALIERVVPRARLLELVRDEQAFDLVRGRALSVLGRYSTSSADVAEVIVLARSVLASEASGRAASRAAAELLERED